MCHCLKCCCFIFLQGIAKKLVKAALTEAAKKKEMRYDDIKNLEKGTRRRFHDDITVIVIYLDGFMGELSKIKGSSFDCTNAPVDIFSLSDVQLEKS